MTAGGARSAEKVGRRVSTCAFADAIARVSIAAHDAAVASLPDPERARLSSGQTVLASIVVRDGRGGGGENDRARVRVVALGAGTKFMTSSSIDSDARGVRVRDCHAEVLARRALKRFLYAQIDIARARRGTVADARSCVLERDARSNRWSIRPDVTFHMYTSSTPCGNATVKRWARGAKEVFDDALDESTPPPDAKTHEKPSFGSVHEGQLAFTYKRDPTALEDDGGEIRERGGGGGGDAAAGAAVHITGRLLSCSDKLAVWNCVGVQGALLLCENALSSPVYLASVTVGRKFNRAILRRALCCRMHRFRGTDAISAAEDGTAAEPRSRVFALNHPGTMCTAVPFDVGTYAPGEGANFDRADALVWWEGRDGGETRELIDARTGSRSFPRGDDDISGVSRAALLREHESVIGPVREASCYEDMKRRAGDASGYAAAKTAALSQPGLWVLSTTHHRAEVR